MRAGGTVSTTVHIANSGPTLYAAYDMQKKSRKEAVRLAFSVPYWGLERKECVLKLPFEFCGSDWAPPSPNCC